MERSVPGKVVRRLFGAPRVVYPAIFLAVLLCAVVVSTFWVGKGREVAAPSGGGPAPQTAGRRGTDDRAGADGPQKGVFDAGEGEKTMVQGRVLDEAGRGISGATVDCIFAEGFDLPADVVRSDAAHGYQSQSDANGCYSVRAFSPGKMHTLRASAEGYVTRLEAALVPEEGLTGLDLVLPRGCGIAGRVVSADGKPVHYAIVVAMLAPGAKRDESPPTAQDGRFELRMMLPGGPYQLKVRRQPPAAGEKGMEWTEETPVGAPEVTLLPGENKEGLELVLATDSGRFVSGRVVDESSAPVSGATVTAMLTATGGDYVFADHVTDATGQFAVAFIPIGRMDTVTVECTCKGYERAVLNDVPVGTADLKITLLHSRRGVIVGTVFDGKTRKPINDAVVLLSKVVCEWGDVQRLPIGESRLDEGRTQQGRFRIADVAPGTALLGVYAPGYGMSFKGGIVVRGGEEVNVDIFLMKGGTLRYTLVPVGNGIDLPLSSCALCVRPVGTEELIDPHTAGAMAGQKDNSGHRSLSGEMELAPGMYDSIMVIERGEIPKEGYRTSERGWYRFHPVEIVAGETTALEEEFGGTASVMGSRPPTEEETLVCALLVAGADIGPLRRLDGLSFEEFWDVRFLKVPFECGEAHRIALISGGYEFASLKPGTYTLGLFELPRDGRSSMIGSQTVTVADGEAAQVNLER